MGILFRILDESLKLETGTWKSLTCVIFKTIDINEKIVRYRYKKDLTFAVETHLVFNDRINGKTEIDLDVKEKPGESGVMNIKERSRFRKEQEINTVEEF